MKRRLRQSYRPSPALLRAQRRLAWRSAAFSLLLLAGLALAAACCALPGLFMAGSHGGSFAAVPFEAQDDGPQAEPLPATPPPESPAPSLAGMQPMPMELLPLESPAPVEFALEEAVAPEPPLQFSEDSLAFRPPVTPRKAAAKPAVKPAAPRPAAAPAGQQAGGRLVSASYRSAPKPPYPPAMRSSRVEGRVGVRIAIDAEGKPTRVDITTPSGHADFDRTARSWILSNWRFNPATRDGEPIPSTVTTRVEFVLS